MRGLLILLILLLLPQWSSKRITMRRAHDSLTTEAAQEVLNIPASSHDYGSLTLLMCDFFFFFFFLFPFPTNENETNKRQALRVVLEV